MQKFFLALSLAIFFGAPVMPIHASDFMDKSIDQATKAGYPMFQCHYNFGINAGKKRWCAGFYKEYFLNYPDGGCILGDDDTLEGAVTKALNNLKEQK